MEKTAVFYGFYSGNGLKNASYDISLAYFLVCISCFCISLFLLAQQ